MKPVEFPGYNIVFGANQPQYQPLPALKVPGPEGEVITCYELTNEEISRVCETKRIYFRQLTFNGPLQPISPLVDLDDGFELMK